MGPLHDSPQLNKSSFLFTSCRRHNIALIEFNEGVVVRVLAGARHVFQSITEIPISKVTNISPRVETEACL